VGTPLTYSINQIMTNDLKSKLEIKRLERNAKARANYQKNKDKRRAYARAYYQKNKAKILAAAKARRAKKKASVLFVEPKDYVPIKEALTPVPRPTVKHGWYTTTEKVEIVAEIKTHRHTIKKALVPKAIVKKIKVLLAKGWRAVDVSMKFELTIDNVLDIQGELFGNTIHA